MNREAFQPVKRQRLHETIADRLEEMIVRGEFAPGETLPTENELASQLEVSRAVVRDAVRVLATKGLVHVRHGVGTFVTESGRERLAEALAISLRRGDYSPWELYVIRRGLELMVVEQAVERATEEQIAAMRALIVEYSLIYLQDQAQGHALHTQFHRLMAYSTGNRILKDLLDPITVFRIPEQLGMAGFPAVDSSALHQEYVAKHLRIVDALAQRDVEEGKAAMLAHLSDLEQRVQRAMNVLAG